jgi:hypothetical protein
VAHENAARASLTIVADSSNSGVIYLQYDDPNVASSGSHKGLPLVAGGQANEQPPEIFTGEVWLVGSGAGQVAYVLETTDWDLIPGKVKA